MGKKSRAPRPPRPVQAPGVRETGRRRVGGRLQFLAIGGAAAAVLVAAAVAALALGVIGGSDDPAAALREAGCTAKTYPDQGANHVQSLDQPVKYNSFPPTSGPHFYQPAIWNAYDEPIDQKMGVHNLEHGGVLIQYGEQVPREQVEQLTNFWRKDPAGLILAPLPKLGNQIALTAWMHLALCPSLEDKAFDAFLDAYRFKGPERLPKEVLQPGT